MIYLIDSIMRDVRIALDQNMVNDNLSSIGDIDTLTVNEIIHSKIEEAVKRVHSDAPHHLLDSGNNFGDAIYWQEHESGWVLLPEDFMRLLVFEMSDWKTAVFNAEYVDSPEYAKQRSKFKGIRGSIQNPKCFIVIRPEGKALEFYSSKSTEAYVRRAVYLPYPIINEENNSIDVCEKCYPAVIYMIAALVLATFGDYDKSKLFNELVKSVLI